MVNYGRADLTGWFPMDKNTSVGIKVTYNFKNETRVVNYSCSTPS